jgi:hypothetical protein
VENRIVLEAEDLEDIEINEEVIEAITESAE